MSLKFAYLVYLFQLHGFTSQSQPQHQLVEWENSIEIELWRKKPRKRTFFVKHFWQLHRLNQAIRCDRNATGKAQ